jgi:Ca2+-binding RTX toxin-like protein
MATFTMNRSLNMNAIPSWNATAIPIATTTQITGIDSSHTGTYYGAFSYDSFGFLTGGTITGYEEYVGGVLNYVIGGGSIDVFLYDAYDSANDLLGALAYVLQFNDTVTGSSQQDTLRGFAGADTLNGGAGNDTIFGDAGDDRIVASLSDGNDTLSGGDGWDILDYSSVPGVVQINQLAGTVTGSAGNDTLLDVFEQIIGSNFNDVLSGGHGINCIDGMGGNDLIFGNNGDDLLRGGDGDDTFFFSANDGDDRMLGGNGWDILDYSNLAGVVQVNQLAGTTTGTANNDILLDTFEQVIGTAFGDVLSGGHGINSLNGGGGDDQIFANGGDDWVRGGTGSDTITLGPGNDVFSFWQGDGSDTVTDFVGGAGASDVIDLQFKPSVVNYAQVQGAMSQVGADTVINFGGGDVITLLNVNLAALHQDDFVFA